MINLRVKIKPHAHLKPVLIGKTGKLVEITEVSASPANYKMFKVKLDEPVTLEMFDTDMILLPAECFEVIQ